MKSFISHVQVPVKDLEEAVAWYVKCLDCEFLSNFGDFALIKFKDDSVNIFLWKTSDITAAAFSVHGELYPTIGLEFVMRSQNHLTTRSLLPNSAYSIGLVLYSFLFVTYRNHWNGTLKGWD